MPRLAAHPAQPLLCESPAEKARGANQVRFENDDACDWLIELCEGQDTRPIIDALTAITESDEEICIEDPECSCAIAAAEIVAAAKGRPSADLPDEAKEWLAENAIRADEGLVTLAKQALARVKADSELWDESESANEWDAAIDDLKARLKA